MSFEEYAGNTAYGTYSAWQDAFSGKSHKFDEEGYKEYAKNKKSIFDKDVKLSEGFIVILILIPVCSILFLNRGLLFPGTENTGKIIMPLILAGGGILGAAFEIHKRNRVAREERGWEELILSVKPTNGLMSGFIRVCRFQIAEKLSLLSVSGQTSISCPDLTC